MELSALERLKIDVATFSRFEFVGIQDVHNILDEFEFQPDRTINYGICSWISKNTPIDL